MSGLKITCPHCKHSLEAPENMLGQVIDCQTCRKHIQVPIPQTRTAPKVVLHNEGIEIIDHSFDILALVTGILGCIACWISENWISVVPLFIPMIGVPLFALIGLISALIGLREAVRRKSGYLFSVCGGLSCAFAIAYAVIVSGELMKNILFRPLPKTHFITQSTIPSTNDPEQTVPGYRRQSAPQPEP